MKKILAVLMCASLVLCASCGKNDEGAAKPEAVQENKVEDVTKDIDKKIAESPDKIETDDIEEARESAKEIEQELKDKAGTVAEEDVEEYQNQQVSVAILQQGLDALEEAKKSGDEEAIKQAQQMIEMAKSLWNYTGEE